MSRKGKGKEKKKRRNEKQRRITRKGGKNGTKKKIQ